MPLRRLSTPRTRALSDQGALPGRSLFSTHIMSPSGVAPRKIRACRAPQLTAILLTFICVIILLSKQFGAFDPIATLRLHSDLSSAPLVVSSVSPISRDSAHPPVTPIFASTSAPPPAAVTAANTPDPAQSAPSGASAAKPASTQPFSGSASSGPLPDHIEAAPNSLFNAWKRASPCDEWIRTMRASNAYLDAYVVGAQKAGTSHLSALLGSLGVRRNRTMIKEWHFYNHISKSGTVRFGRFEIDPLPDMTNLTHLRLQHLSLGFPQFNLTSLLEIDASPLEERTVIIDSTVEYLHSKRAAVMAAALTPHARIIVMIRDPTSRALSQYNMYNRNGNNKRREMGQNTVLATAEAFDFKVRTEVERLIKCGYDPPTATLPANNMTALIACTRKGPVFDNVMYVLRGVYFLQVAQWRESFKDQNMMFIPFTDMSRGKIDTLQGLTRFLCVRPFGSEILSAIQCESSDLSYGQRAARDGLESSKFDDYQGDNRYLAEMWPSTRKFLDGFYARANEKLEEMMGRRMF